MMILKAVGASGDGPGPPSKSFVIKPWVGRRPVQVFTGQGLPAKLAVVNNPLLSFIIPFRPYNRGLVCKKFLSIFGEPRR